MSPLDPDVLDTSFGRLVTEYVNSLLARPGNTTTQEVVACARDLALETVRQLEEELDDRQKSAVRARENLPLEPILWSAPAGEEDRKGFSWSTEERAALFAAYQNGEDSLAIASRHRRTASAIDSQLAAQGAIYRDPKGFGWLDRVTHEPWA